MKRAAPLAFLILTAAAAPHSQTPEQYVRAIYASFDGSPDSGSLGAHQDRYFSKAMLKLFKQDQAAIQAAGGGVGVLDADPVCDCQDDSGLRLRKLDVTPIDATHVLAKVTLNYDHGGHVLLKLIREDRGWRIEDVKDDDQAWLSKRLKDEIHSPSH